LIGVAHWVVSCFSVQVNLILAAPPGRICVLYDFLICGAGISGLLLARELSAAGASVCIVERGDTGREASWAGGGIVSPLYPWRYSDAVTALANHAQSAYPKLAAELLHATGIDPEYCESGLLMLDAPDTDQALSWASKNGRLMSLSSASQIYEREPGLRAGFQSGLWMPKVANVRNPRLLQALRADLDARPLVTLLTQSELLSMDTSAAGVEAVLIRQAGAEQQLVAGSVILSSGAWTAGLLQPLGIRLPVTPVKGQMLLFRSAAPVLSSIVLSQGRYLIPRSDGHILVGSTLEPVGFDKSTDQAALLSLRNSASKILPELDRMPVIMQWAGLRPGAPRGIPFIGAVPGFKNLYVNAGHYRNGLVLAPASASLLADLLLGRRPLIDPQLYDPGERLAQLSDADFALDALIADNSQRTSVQS
jgi:glycine oxidase